jgi:phosphopantetheinyl transferase (holo-ACP synthase)
MYIGNDIVAHHHPRCIGKCDDPYFLNKILTPDEVDFLSRSAQKHELLWVYWTIKEAAYKLSCFLGNRNKFHAKQFSVSLESSFLDEAIFLEHENQALINEHKASATVQFEGVLFYAKTLVTPHFVHSMAAPTAADFEGFVSITSHKSIDKNDYSSQVRQFTKQRLRHFGVQYESIKKDKDGIPFLVYNGGLEKYISLSHDQQFISFVFRP